MLQVSIPCIISLRSISFDSATSCCHIETELFTFCKIRCSVFFYECIQVFLNCCFYIIITCCFQFFTHLIDGCFRILYLTICQLWQIFGKYVSQSSLFCFDRICIYDQVFKWVSYPILSRDLIKSSVPSHQFSSCSSRSSLRPIQKLESRASLLESNPSGRPSLPSSVTT